MILLRANTVQNRRGDSAQVQHCTAAVQRQDFITTLITRNHGNCDCFQQVGGGAVGIVPEPPATLSSAPYIAMLFYFHILKPQGPAPKLCAQNAFPSVLQLQMPVPNRGSQASQDTAGRNLLNRMRDLTQTGCLICLLLSVSIPTTGSQQLREHPKQMSFLRTGSPGKTLGISWTQTLKTSG